MAPTKKGQKESFALRKAKQAVNIKITNLAFMLREYAIVMIGAITLLFAGVGAYGVVFGNYNAQAAPEPISIPDYSDELKSLDYSDELNSMSAQIQEIKSQLNTLQELKSDVSEMQQKLETLEEKATPPKQTATMFLDKSTYQKGENVKVTAIGLEPQQIVNVQILDDDFVIVNKEAFTDSSGKLVYQLALSSALPAGTYNIRIVSGQDTTSEPITVSGSSSGSGSTTTTSGFTASADQSTYTAGDLIKISGTGQANKQISATLTGPSSQTISTASSVQSDGKYTIFFPTSSNTEKGNWQVTVNYQSESIVVSITIS